MHTPSPCKVSNYRVGEFRAPDDRDLAIVSNDLTTLAIVWSGWSRGSDNARLLSAAYASYDKHCGEHSVECAEQDLLGEALELLREIRKWMDSEIGSWDAKFIEQIDTTIAKAPGRTEAKGA